MAIQSLRRKGPRETDRSFHSEQYSSVEFESLVLRIAFLRLGRGVETEDEVERVALVGFDQYVRDLNRSHTSKSNSTGQNSIAVS